jgi:hypothetical protein
MAVDSKDRELFIVDNRSSGWIATLHERAWRERAD